jgi:hypothetical protein
LYSLAGPPCPTNKDEENVVIKIGCNIFTIISLGIQADSELMNSPDTNRFWTNSELCLSYVTCD